MTHKIAFDNHIFRMQKRGGATRYFLELANYLWNFSSFDVSIVAPIHFNDSLNRDKIFSKDNLYLKHSGNKLGVARCLNILSDLKTRSVIRRLGPDLIHETYFKPKSLWDRSIPSVCTIFDLTREIIDGNRQKLERKIQTAHRATRIICISENTKSDFLKFAPVYEEKMVVIPLGCSPIFLEKRDTRLNFDKPYVLFVGQRAGYKNFSLLLQALSSLKDFRGQFNLIAFGGGQFTSSEKEEIHSLGLETSVKFDTGDDELLSLYYRSAMCFVYPSLYEGFGLPILEALASGCRVICSSTSSFPEVGASLVNYFDPRDLSSLRIAIDRILREDRIDIEWKFQSYAHALKYSWDKVGNLTVNEYMKALS